MACSSCGSSTPPPAPVTATAVLAVDSSAAGPSLSERATVIKLADMREKPADYEWFQFKPGVKKLILSGTPDARHVSVLWYGYEGQAGAVPLHYHAQTESIFVIDGAQSDAKGTYTKGSFYFNPPGSGHDISNSSGLFLLSYAAPPDFKRTAEIGAYENVVVPADYAKLSLTACDDGSQCLVLPLADNGGMRSRFVAPRSSAVTLTANVLLVLRGSCVVGGQPLAADTLVVQKSSEPGTYQVAAAEGDCLVFEMAFR